MFICPHAPPSVLPARPLQRQQPSSPGKCVIFLVEEEHEGDSMKLGYVGLGKMGMNMVERLMEKGHRVTVFDQSTTTVAAARSAGATVAESLRDVTDGLKAPRLVWLMVPHQAVDAVLAGLVTLLSPGDTVIDGGNSPYRESVRRARELEAKGIEFLDAGVSGGPSGARSGACIMVGGKADTFRRFEVLFADLAVAGGYAHVGRSGAGHFVKMVHNGIEYGMMQALAEGFAVMRASPFGIDLLKVADLYNHRSVIESRLVGWLRDAYEQSGPDLADVSGAVAQSGEGMWTVEAGRELGVPTPVIAEALAFRIASGEQPSYTGRVLSALRHAFGGHEAKARQQPADGTKGGG
jgi:6-phosphogluconate dehydrogenase